MNWFQPKGQQAWLSAPYSIYRQVRGYELWVYSKGSGIVGGPGILGREIKTLELAKDMAEVHKAKHARPKD